MIRVEQRLSRTHPYRVRRCALEAWALMSIFTTATPAPSELFAVGDEVRISGGQGIPRWTRGHVRSPATSQSPPTASDCLFILRAAVGSATCDQLNH